MKKNLLAIFVALFLNSCTTVNSPTLLFKTPGYTVSIPTLGFSKLIGNKEEAFYEIDTDLNVSVYNMKDTFKFNIKLQKDSTVFFTEQDGVIINQTVSRF